MRNVFVALCCLCITAAAFSDAKLVQKVKSDPVMGQKAQDTTMTIYLKDQKARIETAGTPQYQIVDMTAGKMFMVDPGKKEVMVMDNSQMKQASGMLSQLLGGGKKGGEPPSVQKLGSSKMYNGHKCEEYKISMSVPLPTSGVYCVSSDVDLQKELQPLTAFSQEFAQMFGGEIFAQLQGFPVHTDATTSIMGQNIRTSSDLISYSKENQPESLFVVPADFTQKEMALPKFN